MKISILILNVLILINFSFSESVSQSEAIDIAENFFYSKNQRDLVDFKSQESIDIEYQNLREGKISPMEYIAITEVTSSQVTTQISEFVTSKPSEQWQESYISYMNGMKKFNEYILETKVLANQIENESLNAEILQTIDKIESIKAESIEYVKKSNELRP